MSGRLLRRYRLELLVWLALMSLLFATLGSAFFPMGSGNVLTNMAIGTGKTLLVAVFFMHLRSSEAVIRLASAAGLLWLAFLFSLTFADILTRG